MKEMNLPQTILLALGVLMLIKSVWGIAHPSSMKRAGSWWSRASLQVNTLCAIVYMLITAGLLVAVLLNQPLTNWLLVAVCVFTAWAASIYLKPQELQKLIRRLVTGRSLLAIRIMSLITAAAALFLIWAAHKGI